jgi:hypothetical protein
VKDSAYGEIRLVLTWNFEQWQVKAQCFPAEVMGATMRLRKDERNEIDQKSAPKRFLRNS